MLEFFKRKKSAESLRANVRSETEKVEKPKRDFLNDWDRNTLNKGLTNVVQTMLKDFDGRLPTAIVFPDTSARPLVYALLPGFKRLNEHRGIPVPRCYFFRSEKPDVILATAELAKEYETNDTIDTMDELKSHLKSIGYDDDLIETQTSISNPESTKISRDIMKTRVQEILTYESKSQEGAEIAVVDEYATESAMTAKEIRRAFGMPDMHVYTVFAQDNDVVQAGIVVDPYDRETMNPGKRHKAKLSYSGTYGVGVTKDPKEHGKYSTRIPDNPLRAIPEHKAQLRNEMRIIGEEVADTIEKYLSESKAA